MWYFISKYNELVPNTFEFNKKPFYFEGITWDEYWIEDVYISYRIMKHCKN